MQTVFEHEFYKMYWYDTEHTILVCEVYAGWGWHHIYDMLIRGKSIMEDVANPKYGIIHMIDKASQLPKNQEHAVRVIRQLLNLKSPDEDLLFFVGKFQMLKVLIRATSTLHNLLSTTAKYRYAHTLTEAIHEIEEHQAHYEIRSK